MGRRERPLSGGYWYAREARLRGSFLASIGHLEPGAIAKAAQCSESDALLLSCARRLASLEALELYAKGRMTWCQLWRVCEYSGDPKRQRVACAGIGQ